MTSAFESALNEVMADVEKQRDDLLRLHNSLDEVVGTARSKRRQVSAKVDARGEILELKLHGDTYRSMAATELANLIVDTIRQARQAAKEQMWESLADTLPEGVEVAKVIDGTQDWSEVLGNAVALPKPLMDMLSGPSQSFFEDVDLSAVVRGMTGVSEGESGDRPDTPANGANGRSNGAAGGNDAGGGAPRPRSQG